MTQQKRGVSFLSMANRIQWLRKARGVSQEELANEVGVSRQAVSEWEIGQSMPDLDKIIVMSECFDVTTDYLLKGTEPAASKGQKGRELAGRIVDIASTTLIAIGLFCALGDWHEAQAMAGVWGAAIIQAVGVAAYFIGRLLSPQKAPLAVSWLNMVMGLFIPLSMLTGFLSILLFNRGWIAPYPVDLWHAMMFTVVHAGAGSLCFAVLKNRHG